jgi:hypothetical protein
MSIKKYIGYREQEIQCDKNGNRIEVSCVRCSQTNLICIKYKTYCHSGACLKERLDYAHKTTKSK